MSEKVGTDKDACFKAPKGGRSQFGEDGGALGRLVQNSTNEYGEVTKPTERWLEPRHDILKHHPGPSEVTSLRAKTARFDISIPSSKVNTKFRVIKRPSKVRALKYRWQGMTETPASFGFLQCRNEVFWGKESCGLKMIPEALKTCLLMVIHAVKRNPLRFESLLNFMSTRTAVNIT